ncbi:MAG: hypothetical protein ACI836_001279 [Saprospiraceae bacterium]|jgi:hypothetical protein|uniref:leucine-rich repeat domain-containing protein n=1 Tax=Patiriisocius sp. Uisw_047 TaxID=3230969 RepID=UPI0039ED4E53
MKKLITLFTMLFMSACLFAQVSEGEKHALLDFYISTNGDTWNTTWDANTPVAEWHGVTVKNNQVVAVNLMFNNLKGHLPTSIGQLENLQSLELSFNQITGTLPVSIGGMTQLKTLAINGNQLEGTIPESLGNLSNLEQLHLSSNNFSGSIPSSLGGLANLETLNVFDNSLTGTIPLGLSQFSHLKKLVIAENDIIAADTFAQVNLFEVDNDNTLFKTPKTFKEKTVLAIETSDDTD